MTTIKATCPGCGEVELTPDDITLTEDQYSFDCPTCYEKIHKQADDRVKRLLISGGVVITVTVATVAPRFCHPPITVDDVIDFHVALNQPGWFDLLTLGVQP